MSFDARENGVMMMMNPETNVPDIIIQENNNDDDHHHLPVKDDNADHPVPIIAEDPPPPLWEVSFVLDDSPLSSEKEKSSSSSPSTLLGAQNEPNHSSSSSHHHEEEEEEAAANDSTRAETRTPWLHQSLAWLVSLAEMDPAHYQATRAKPPKKKPSGPDPINSALYLQQQLDQLLVVRRQPPTEQAAVPPDNDPPRRREEDVVRRLLQAIQRFHATVALLQQEVDQQTEESIRLHQLLQQGQEERQQLTLSLQQHRSVMQRILNKWREKKRDHHALQNQVQQLTQLVQEKDWQQEELQERHAVVQVQAHEQYLMMLQQQQQQQQQSPPPLLTTTPLLPTTIPANWWPWQDSAPRLRTTSTDSNFSDLDALDYLGAAAASNCGPTSEANEDPHEAGRARPGGVTRPPPKSLARWSRMSLSLEALPGTNSSSSIPTNDLRTPPWSVSSSGSFSQWSEGPATRGPSLSVVDPAASASGYDSDQSHGSGPSTWLMESPTTVNTTTHDDPEELGEVHEDPLDSVVDKKKGAPAVAAPLPRVDPRKRAKVVTVMTFPRGHRIGIKVRAVPLWDFVEPEDDDDLGGSAAVHSKDSPLGRNQPEAPLPSSSGMTVLAPRWIHSHAKSSKRGALLNKDFMEGSEPPAPEPIVATTTHPPEEGGDDHQDHQAPDTASTETSKKKNHGFLPFHLGALLGQSGPTPSKDAEDETIPLPRQGFIVYDCSGFDRERNRPPALGTRILAIDGETVQDTWTLEMVMNKLKEAAAAAKTHKDPTASETFTLTFRNDLLCANQLERLGRSPSERNRPDPPEDAAITKSMAHPDDQMNRTGCKEADDATAETGDPSEGSAALELVNQNYYLDEGGTSHAPKEPMLSSVKKGLNFPLFKLSSVGRLSSGDSNQPHERHDETVVPAEAPLEGEPATTGPSFSPLALEVVTNFVETPAVANTDPLDTLTDRAGPPEGQKARLNFMPRRLSMASVGSWMASEPAMKEAQTPGHAVSEKMTGDEHPATETKAPPGCEIENTTSRNANKGGGFSSLAFWHRKDDSKMTTTDPSPTTTTEVHHQKLVETSPSNHSETLEQQPTLTAPIVDSHSSEVLVSEKASLDVDVVVTPKATASTHTESKSSDSSRKTLSFSPWAVSWKAPLAAARLSHSSQAECTADRHEKDTEKSVHELL